MAATTERHFAWFKRCIKKWMKICSLGDWDVYYQHTDCGTFFSEIIINTQRKILSVKLNIEWPKLLPLNNQSIDDVACHEVVHIRTARLDYLAGCRYVREEELDAADEELVVWITKMLLDGRQDGNNN